MLPLAPKVMSGSKCLLIVDDCPKSFTWIAGSLDSLLCLLDTSYRQMFGSKHIETLYRFSNGFVVAYCAQTMVGYHLSGRSHQFTTFPFHHYAVTTCVAQREMVHTADRREYIIL